MKKGEKMSDKQKRKVSKNRKGKCLGNNFGFKKGQNPFNKGKKGLQVVWNKGLTTPEKSVRKMVEERKKRGNYIAWNKETKGFMPIPWNKNKPHLAVRGEKNPNWKGGITPENRRIKLSIEYSLWRQAVFERDNYTCIWCGYKSHKKINGKSDIHADHIKQFAFYPELRLAIDNGRTLCIPCHRTTETWGNRIKTDAD